MLSYQQEWTEALSGPMLEHTCLLEQAESKVLEIFPVPELLAQGGVRDCGSGRVSVQGESFRWTCRVGS